MTLNPHDALTSQLKLPQRESNCRKGAGNTDRFNQTPPWIPQNTRDGKGCPKGLGLTPHLQVKTNTTIISGQHHAIERGFQRPTPKSKTIQSDGFSKWGSTPPQNAKPFNSMASQNGGGTCWSVLFLQFPERHAVWGPKFERSR